MRRTFVFRTVLVAVILACLLPLISHGQTTTPPSDLSATIRAELLSDPRTAGLSQTQIDAMVDVLTQAAQKQGVTARDITWRPQPTQTFSPSAAQPAPACGGLPPFLCALNSAFGFDGSDPTIPIGLGVTSAILILIIATMMEMKRRAAQSTTPL